MKSRIFGTVIGQDLLKVQQNLSFRTMSLHNPEQAGLRANHIIADRLITRLCPRGGTFLDMANTPLGFSIWSPASRFV